MFVDSLAFCICEMYSRSVLEGTHLGLDPLAWTACDKKSQIHLRSLSTPGFGMPGKALRYVIKKVLSLVFVTIIQGVEDAVPVARLGVRHYSLKDFPQVAERLAQVLTISVVCALDMCSPYRPYQHHTLMN